MPTTMRRAMLMSAHAYSGPNFHIRAADLAAAPGDCLIVRRGTRRSKAWGILSDLPYKTKRIRFDAGRHPLTNSAFLQAKKRAWRRISKPSKGERCLVPQPGERCCVFRCCAGYAFSGTRRGAIMFSGRRMSSSMASSSRPSSRTSSSTPRPLSRAMRAIRVAFS